MRKVQLGYKAFDLHELACHFVALEAGIYAELELDVELVDTRLANDEQLPADQFSAACGSALVRWIGGADLKVAFAATQRPLFFLVAQRSIQSWSELSGTTLASYPAAAPPAVFLAAVLRDEQVADSVSVTALPDDASRMDALASGDAHGALVSSATTDRALAERGLHRFACIGDSLPAPSTGLAISRSLFQRDPLLVAAMRDAHRYAIRRLHQDDALLQSSLARELVPEPADLDAASRLVQSSFTPDGLVSPANCARAVKKVAVAMGADAPTDPLALYDCALRVE